MAEVRLESQTTATDSVKSADAQNLLADALKKLVIEGCKNPGAELSKLLLSSRERDAKSE
jgi:hypothetical protein